MKQSIAPDGDRSYSKHPSSTTVQIICLWTSAIIIALIPKMVNAKYQIQVEDEVHIHVRTATMVTH